jgi:hypothetical protein
MSGATFRGTKTKGLVGRAYIYKYHHVFSKKKSRVLYMGRENIINFPLIVY